MKGGKRNGREGGKEEQTAVLEDGGPGRRGNWALARPARACGGCFIPPTRSRLLRRGSWVCGASRGFPSTPATPLGDRARIRPPGRRTRVDKAALGRDTL